jgi:hypothetical protein
MKTTSVLISLAILPAVTGHDGLTRKLRAAIFETTRSLQLGNIGNTICSTIGNVVGFACGCNIALVPPALSASCSTKSQVCAPGNILCGTPGASFNFNPSIALEGGGSPVGFNVCFNSMSVVGIPVSAFQLPPFTAGGLCIDPTNVLGGLGADALNGTDTCTATLNATACESCELCLTEAGVLTGVKFDCENVYPGVLSSSCSPMGVSSGIGADSSEGRTSSIFLPMFDALSELSVNSTGV